MIEGHAERIGRCGMQTMLFAVAALIGLACLWPQPSGAAEFQCPNGAQVKTKDLCQYFKFYRKDMTGADSRVLEQLGIDQNQTVRSIAVVVGIDTYPNLSDANLPPAKRDLDNLTKFLIDGQHFDEVIVLHNGEATKDRIRYFLEDYIPGEWPLFQSRSRVLFAYTGHGVQGGASNEAGLVMSDATSAGDTNNLYPLNSLATSLQNLAKQNFQVLALVNACYGGDLLQISQGGGNIFISNEPGAHAMTAGSPDELVWSLPGKNSGSIFFDNLIGGVTSGDADLTNRVTVVGENGKPYTAPVGVIRLGSLLEYMTNKLRDLGNNPKTGKPYTYPWLGSVNVPGKPSVGAFFFLGPQTADAATVAALQKLAPNATVLASNSQLSSTFGVSFSLRPGATSSAAADPAIKIFNPPENYPVHGIDVSEYNQVDWGLLSKVNIQFVYMRATDILGTDKAFVNNWRAAKQAGVVRGAYHYFGVCEDPKAQFDRIAATVEMGPQDLPFALDLEWPVNKKLTTQIRCANKLGTAQVSARVYQLLKLLKDHYGRTPVIYGNKGVFDTLLRDHYAEYPVWIGDRDSKTPEVRLSGKVPWSFWQYTGEARIAGVKGQTDESVFFGTPAQFDSFIGANSVAKEPTNGANPG